MQPVVIKSINKTIKVGYSGKALGNTQASANDGKDNFVKFAASFPGKKVYDMPAVGKDKIINIDGMPFEQVDSSEADALVTSRRDVVLTLRAADCIPLVFYVPGEQVLALAHAGTSGAALHLPAKVIDFLKIVPAKLHVYVGPSIGKDSYKFAEGKFEKKLDTSWDPYISRRAGHVHIDLLGYVLDELASCGINSQNIEVEGVDTGSDLGHFSHRRHKLTGEPTGRNAFGVCLVGSN